MKEKMNIWSFGLSIICLLLFFIFAFSGLFNDSIMGTHPLNIVLSISLLTFFLGVVGLGGIRNGRGMARSMATIILTAGLLLMLTTIIFFGRLAN